MWSVALSKTRDTLSVIKGVGYLQRKGEAPLQVTNSEAKLLLDREARHRRDRTVVALQQTDDPEMIEFVLAVNFAYLRRISRVRKELL